MQPETAVFARKGEIELGFRLGQLPNQMFFSLEIKLLGHLGEEATPEPKLRGFGLAQLPKVSTLTIKSLLQQKMSRSFKT